MNKIEIEQLMGKVMRDEEKGLINADTVDMIEIILSYGTLNELKLLTEGYYWTQLQSYINDCWVLVEWIHEEEGLTHTKVRLNYIDIWAEIENYPQYTILKVLN
jgi:hypothetical protein